MSILWIALFVLICACTTPANKPQRKVAIGGKWSEALSLLKEVGAKETQLAMLPPPKGIDGRAFELLNGNLLYIEAKKSQITTIRLCPNSDKPKSKRAWAQLKEVDL